MVNPIKSILFILFIKIAHILGMSRKEFKKILIVFQIMNHVAETTHASKQIKLSKNKWILDRY